MMSQVYTEHRQLKPSVSLTRDIAHHLYSRQFDGKVLIIASHPARFLTNLKRQWQKLTTTIEHSQAAQTGTKHASLLDRQLSFMHKLEFTNDEPLDRPHATVYVLGVEHLAGVLPYCRTLYVTCPVDHEIIEPLIGIMPSKTLVVLYI